MIGGLIGLAIGFILLLGLTFSGVIPFHADEDDPRLAFIPGTLLGGFFMGALIGLGVAKGRRSLKHRAAAGREAAISAVHAQRVGCDENL